MQKTRLKTQKDKSMRKNKPRAREIKEGKESAIYTITTLHIISSYVLQHYYLGSSRWYVDVE